MGFQLHTWTASAAGLEPVHWDSYPVRPPVTQELDDPVTSQPYSSWEINSGDLTLLDWYLALFAVPSTVRNVDCWG